MDFVATTWFLPVAASSWCVLIALLVWGYFVAQRPPKGSLQWIADFDRPTAHWAKSRHDLDKVDGVVMAAVAVFGAVATFTMTGTFSFDFVNFADGFFAILSYILLPMVACIATFWVVKSMTGDTAAGFLAGILVGLDVFTIKNPVASVAVTTALLYNYATLPHSPKPWSRTYALALLGGSFALGVYFYGGLIWMIIPIIAVVFLVNWEYFRENGYFWRHVTCHIGTFSLFAVIVLVWMFFPRALIEGQPILSSMLRGEFYQMVGTMLWNNMTTAFSGRGFYYAVFTVMTHWPLLILGVAMVPVLWHSWRRLGHWSAVLTMILGLTIVVIWLTTATSALFYGVAMAMAFLWSQLKAKGKYLLLIPWVIVMFFGIFLMYIMIL